MVMKPGGRVMSALLWCELMNWLDRRPAVCILVPPMSRSLRVIMSARRPPLSQSLLGLAPWESLHTCSQALQPLPHPGPWVCWLHQLRSQPYTQRVEGS